MVYVGIDVSKVVLAVALVGPEPPTHRRLPNTPDGIAGRIGWLTPQAVTLVAVEATGAYHVPVLTALLAAALPVTRVNPAQIKAFRRASGGRTKTDRQDALLIARFAALYAATLVRVHPATPQQARLRALVGDRKSLLKRRTALRNQPEAASFRGDTTIGGFLAAELEHLAMHLAEVEAAIQAVLAEIPEAAVLDAMPGVGWRTVAAVLADLPAALWGHAKQAAASAGVHPAQHQSGTRSTSRMSQQGHAGLRHARSCAAVPALCWNAPLKAVFARHHAAGKSNMAALGIVMHTLLRQLMGRLRAYYADQAARSAPATA